MNLIQEYIQLANNCARTDYEDQKSVRKHNKSVDRMYEIAWKIGSEKIKKDIFDFAKLLDFVEYKTNIWAATHLLELIPVDKKVEEKAMCIIQKAANGESAESMGFKIWLKHYNVKRKMAR